MRHLPTLTIVLILSLLLTSCDLGNSPTAAPPSAPTREAMQTTPTVANTPAPSSATPSLAVPIRSTATVMMKQMIGHNGLDPVGVRAAVNRVLASGGMAAYGVGNLISNRAEAGPLRGNAAVLMVIIYLQDYEAKEVCQNTQLNSWMGLLQSKLIYELGGQFPTMQIPGDLEIDIVGASGRVGVSIDRNMFVRRTNCPTPLATAIAYAVM